MALIVRKILFVLWLLPAMHAVAQQAAPPAGSNWQRVTALPIGTQIVVKARSHNQTCNLKAVDSDTLTCGPHGVLGNAKDVVFQQAEIKLIKITRRGRSALIGAGISGVAGAITGFAATTNNGGFFGPNFLRGPATAGMAIGVGAIGALIGVSTDFASSTIYKAP